MFNISINPSAPDGAYVNIRETGGGTLGTKIGTLVKGQVGVGEEVLGSPTGQHYCLKITSGATSGWAYARWNNSPTYAEITQVEDPPIGEGEYTVEVFEDGELKKSIKADVVVVSADDQVVYQK